ncbi:MAG: COX15/CtaA family protein [Tuberibacillus sp.]
MDRALRYLGYTTTLGMLIVVIMGALVTNTGSELGCGHSWPLCYGQVVPDNMQKDTWIELSHRAVSGLLGFMIVILSIWAWIRLSNIKGTKSLAVASVFFVVLQGLLGGAAVIWNQSSFVLALHFGISLISFASVLLLTVVITEQTKPLSAAKKYISDRQKINIFSIIVYAYIVIYTGAFVRHTDSAMGCTGWPLCNGEWIPDLYSRAGFQFIHRLLAGILVVWIVTTFILAILKYQSQKWFVRSTLIAAISVLSQAVTGALAVFTHMSLYVLLLHSFFVTLLFGALSFMTMFALRSSSDYKTPNDKNLKESF